MFKIKGGISHKGTKTTKQNISRQDSVLRVKIKYKIFIFVYKSA